MFLDGTLIQYLFLVFVIILSLTLYAMSPMRKNNLCLQGISIGTDCPLSIRKNLKINTIYPFIRSFKDFNLENPTFPVESHKDELPSNFYSDHNCNLKINISAIVGENGSGKSSLVDILIRLLNNLSFYLGKTYNSNHEFYPIIGLRATLYYSIGDSLYRLIQTGMNKSNPSKIIELKLQTLSKGKWINININKKNLGDLFFYNIFLNYSIHAFNPKDYEEEMETDLRNVLENAHWLNACFHKNDGYQAPIVLNPKRDKGNIDINIENHLAKSRLISLIFKNGKFSGSFTFINKNTKIFAIILKTDKESVEIKLKKIWQIWEKQNISFTTEKKEFIFKTIINFWKNKYKFKKLSKVDKLYDLSVNYLVYKTLSIVITYDAFENFKALSPLNNYDNLNNWEEEINELLKEISNEPSHITFRLRQTLAFLVHRQYKVAEGEKKTYSISNFSDILSNLNMSNNWEVAELAPPPIFRTEILVKNDLSNEEFLLSKLSSGEKQLAYGVSTIIYHLRNLDSIQKSNRRINYRQVAIILDEIELYFHPGYQRLFISHLIEALYSVTFSNIKSLHFIVITHSPFILSDIPKSNVLFLKNALPDFEMQENTFASNIHFILRNGFFMEDGTMGVFAKNKVNDLFRKLHENDLNDDLKKEILLVSEPILRTQLINMYEEIIGLNNSNNIISLKKEIEFLRKEIENIKNDTNK